jgi:hypothetical protein
VVVPESFAENFRRVAELAGWGADVIAEEKSLVRAIIARGPEEAKAAFDLFAYLRRELEHEQDPGRRAFKAGYAAGELKAAKPQ